MEHPFWMFLDHTQRPSTVGRTPLDEWSARRRDLYLTTHDTHNRQISMPPVGFDPTISAGERQGRIGHILRRNCLLQRVTEGKIQGGIEVTGRQGRRRKKLLDDLKERRGYYHLKEEALDRTMWRARFGRGFGPVVRQTTKWMNHSLLGSQSVESRLYLEGNKKSPVCWFVACLLHV